MADRLLAAYATEEAIVSAIHKLHAEGFRQIEAYMPFPSHEVDRALGDGHSRLPYVIFGVGIAGAVGAYLLQWFLVAYLYPLVVGSRPPHFPLAFVIITFEMGVLLASLTAFFGTLAYGKLGRLTDDVQSTPGFESVTRDRFWLEVSMLDPAYDDVRTRDMLNECGAVQLGSPEGYR